MGLKGGRPALPAGERRTKAWRVNITEGEWEAAQAYLQHHQITMADVLWRGTPLTRVLSTGQNLLARSKGCAGEVLTDLPSMVGDVDGD